MNWYFEIDGISQGPLTAEVLAIRVQKGEVHADTLVWHPGLGDWQPVGQLCPDWLKPIPAPAPVAMAKPVAGRPGTRPLAPLATEPTEEKQGFFSKLFGRSKKK
jgi:hypothetical protein